MNLIEKKCDITHTEYLYSKGQSNNSICILHGYGASMNDLAPIQSYIDPENKFNWYFLNGPLKVDIGMHMQGRAWFPIDMAALELALRNNDFRSFKEASSQEFIDSLELCQKFCEHHLKNDELKILGGFSQGAMISTHLALKESNYFNALICMSGTLIDQPQLIKALEKSNKIPFIQSHGKMDQVLSYAQAKELFELLKLGGHQGEFISFDGAHEIPLNVLNKINEFIKKI